LEFLTYGWTDLALSSKGSLLRLLMEVVVSELARLRAKIELSCIVNFIELSLISP
jgi:hypothetical protein